MNSVALRNIFQQILSVSTTFVAASVPVNVFNRAEIIDNVYIEGNPTLAWQEGAEVRGYPHIARGTAIATFESDGSYTSESGNHAAIYLYQDERGIWVYDQWQGQPVHKRLIRFEGGSGSKWGSKSNDGRRFAVIE